MLSGFRSIILAQRTIDLSIISAIDRPSGWTERDGRSDPTQTRSDETHHYVIDVASVLLVRVPNERQREE